MFPLCLHPNNVAPQLQVGGWECGSFDRVPVGHARSPGFQSQDGINGVMEHASNPNTGEVEAGV